MTELSQGPTIEDFENALRQASANLFIMYKHNGGDETRRTVIALMTQAIILSPYLEEVLEGLKDEAFQKLATPLQQAITKAKGH